MANRKNTFLIKRSNVIGKVPSAGDLKLGELALNTADVILYTSGTTANSILPIGWDRINRSGDTMNGTLYGPSFSATTISATTYYGDGSNLTGIPNTFLTGTTLTTGNTLELTRNDGITVTQDLSSLDFSLKPGGIWTGGTSLQYYVYRDGGWLGWAKTDTEDRLAPLEIGGPVNSMPDPYSFDTDSFDGVVHSGHKYIFTKSGEIKEIKIQGSDLNANTSYRVKVVDVTNPSTPISVDFVEPILVDDVWKVVAYNSVLVNSGTTWYVYLDVLNNGTSSEVVGGWNIDSTTGGVPSSGGLTLDSLRTFIRYNDTDLDNTDRSTELGGVISGSSIIVVETLDSSRIEEYVIDGPPIDGGSYWEYPIQLVDVNKSVRSGRVSTNTITIPLDSNTVYNEKVGYWSNTANTVDFAIVEGYLKQNGTLITGATANAYSVDVTFQELAFSDDWFYMASSTAGNSGGGSTSENDIYVTGATFSTGNTLTLTRNDNVDIDVILSGGTPAEGYGIRQLDARGIGNGNTYADYGELNGVKSVILFDGNATEKLLTDSVVAGDIDLTSGLTVVFSVFTTTTPISGSSDTVYFELEVRNYSNGDVAGKAADETLSNTITLTGGTSNTLQSYMTFDLDETLMQSGDITGLLLNRIPSNGADNYNADLAIGSIWLVYKEKFVASI